MARRRSRFVRLADRVPAGSTCDALVLIASGQVMVNGVIVSNPSALVPCDAAVRVSKPLVLRGTLKLRSALACFDAGVAGAVCLDVGAAAGGFTAALLEAGARRVYAIDAGYGQLRSWLAQDDRVVSLERTNLGALRSQPALIAEPVDVVCLDLSYLSVAEALPQLPMTTMAPSARLIGLVKPTFELGAGILVTDEEAIARAVESATAAATATGWQIRDQVHAVSGAGGAREVFIFGTLDQRARNG